MLVDIKSPRVEIHYCTRCRFILRATWIAQEVLMTFGEKVGELVLVPSGGGVFKIVLDGDIIFSREKLGCFPDSTELKQFLRNRIDPNMNLGHSEN